MFWGHNADYYFFNLSWNILHTIYILQLQQPVHRLKIEILVYKWNSSDNHEHSADNLLSESYLKTFIHTICRLQREQPVCRFKAKTLTSQRKNETTQTTLFSLVHKKCFDIKDNLYNQFFIITSTNSWTFSNKDIFT